MKQDDRQIYLDFDAQLKNGTSPRNIIDLKKSRKFKIP